MSNASNGPRPLKPNPCVPMLRQNRPAQIQRDALASPPMLLAEMNPRGQMNRHVQTSRQGRMSRRGRTNRRVRMNRTGRTTRTSRISRQGQTNLRVPMNPTTCLVRMLRHVRTNPRVRTSRPTCHVQMLRQRVRINRNVRHNLDVQRPQDLSRKMLRVRTRPSSGHRNRRNPAVRTCRDRSIRWSGRLRRRSRVRR